MPMSIAIALAFWFGQALPSHGETVWFWFATCGGPSLTIEVKVQGTVIQKMVVPVCRAPREAPGSQGQTAGRIDFSFRTQRRVTWEGYRDAGDRTPAGLVIEGALWQAGADPNAILVGVSFSARDRVLMNTIHIARLDRRNESTVARGITVATYPDR